MCEQCLVEMLTLYSENKSGSHLYVGIARKDWDPDILEGEILIGQSNGPDILIREDLFSLQDWKFSNWEEDDDDNPIWKFVEGLEDNTILVPKLLENPNWIPNAVINVHNHFGSPPEDFGSNWAVWVVVKVAKILEDLGIPLDLEGRKEWALQIPPKIDRILVKQEDEDRRRYSVSYMIPSQTTKDDWKLKEVEWWSNESLPEFT